MVRKEEVTMVCKVCGRGPAQEFKLRRHVGMLVMQRFIWFKGPLCRDHGRQYAKDYLNKTLVQGWWGIISFFANWYAVFTDLSALSKAKKMAAPVDVQMAAPVEVQMPPPPPPPPPPPEGPTAASA
jgi:hypothetical protein